MYALERKFRVENGGFSWAHTCTWNAIHTKYPPPPSNWDVHLFNYPVVLNYWIYTYDTHLLEGGGKFHQSCHGKKIALFHSIFVKMALRGTYGNALCVKIRILISPYRNMVSNLVSNRFIAFTSSGQIVLLLVFYYSVWVWKCIHVYGPSRRV